MPYAYVFVFNSERVRNQQPKRIPQQITKYELIDCFETTARSSFIPASVPSLPLSLVSITRPELYLSVPTNPH